MPERSEWPKLHYVAHFRTARGGRGICYETARAELLAALAPLGPSLVQEVPGQMRVHFVIPRELQPCLLRVAEHLGYTEALTRASRYACVGRQQKARCHGRLLLGAQRLGDDCCVFELIWQADERARLARSPDQRPFEYAPEERSTHPQGRKFRRLSPCDAMLLLNLARVRPGALVVEPFAGIGGIVQECRRRRLACVCGDLDASLRPGLQALSGGMAAVWDARRLPLPSALADAVVTEPPYHRRYRDAVVDSLPELARIVKPGAAVTMLLPDDLTDEVEAAALSSDLRVTESHPVRRSRMQGKALVMRRRAAAGARLGVLRP